MLRLFQGNVTDVSALGGCARLHTLDLSYCRQLLDVSALGGCAALRTLDLSQCSLLSDVSALRAARRYTRSTSGAATESQTSRYWLLAGCTTLHTLNSNREIDVSVLRGVRLLNRRISLISFTT